MKAWAKRDFILCANTDLTFFPALLRSLIKSLGSEHTWNHSFRTGRQMERNSSLFPVFCLQGIFGISFRKRGCDPEPSSVSRLSFPTVNLAWQWHTAREGEVYLRAPTASCMSSMELKSNTERQRQQERKGKSSLWKQNRSTYSVTLPQSLLVDPTELQRLHSWGRLLCFRKFLDACNKLRTKLTNYISDTSELFDLFYSKQSWQNWQSSVFSLCSYFLSCWRQITTVEILFMTFHWCVCWWKITFWHSFYILHDPVSGIMHFIPPQIWLNPSRYWN